MNREVSEQEWLDFYEAEDMDQVEMCRKGDLLNYYGPSPDRLGYQPAEWWHYAESQMWLNVAADILTTKNKNGNFMSINKKQLAFILDYLHWDAVIPQAVMNFISDSLRGVGKKGTSKSIVEKWAKRKKEFDIGVDAFGDEFSKETIGKLFGAKPNPDLSAYYPDKVAELSEKHKVNEGAVKKAMKKYNPRNR